MPTPQCELDTDSELKLEDVLSSVPSLPAQLVASLPSALSLCSSHVSKVSKIAGGLRGRRKIWEVAIIRHRNFDGCFRTIYIKLWGGNSSYKNFN